jgi:hypothetical protein
MKLLLITGSGKILVFRHVPEERRGKIEGSPDKSLPGISGTKVLDCFVK